MVCFSANLFSQSDEIRIMDITVEGNQRLTAQDVQRNARLYKGCLLYTSPSPRDRQKSRMPSSA